MLQMRENDGAIVYAKTRDGIVLPVIDVSHPSFAVPEDADAKQAQQEHFIAWERKNRRLPKFIMRILLHSLAKRSRLAGAMFNSNKGFLDGITTYVLKLGESNLPPPFDGPADRRFASSPNFIQIRLRTQQIARLLSDALVEPLARTPGAPLHLINIGGGPALDSINALILINRSRPDVLKRSITIDVLDYESDGAFFGANALTALKAEGGPLQGLDAVFTHRSYNWNEPAVLAELMRELVSQGALIAASSEGALFEYGSDEAIISNLKVLKAGGSGAIAVAGSVTKDDAIRRRMIANTPFKLFPRGIEGFAPLAAQADFAIAKVETALMSDQVLLR